MQPSLRVARVDVSGYRLLSSAFDELDELHRELQRVIRRHLSLDTASVLCVPVPGTDGVTVDWYTDLTGQPAQLTSLPPAQRAAAKRKLNDRLNALRRLAEQLPARVRGSEAIAAALKSATHYPDDSHVYVVEDEPVLTLWGFVLANPGGRRSKIGSPEAVAAGRCRRRVGAVVAVLAVMLGSAGAAAWWWWLDSLNRSLEAELERAVASRCADPDLLPALSLRLNELDPEQRAYQEIRDGIRRAQRRCEVEGSRSRALAAAGWECSALAALERDWATRQTTSSATGTPERTLQQKRQMCLLAADLEQRLEKGRGDCGIMTELDAKLAKAAPEEKPLTDLRPALDKELSRCRAAAELRTALTDAGRDCEQLKAVDARLSREDATRAPLLSLRGGLDAELAICATANELDRKRIDAQAECNALRKVAQSLSEQPATDQRFASIRAQLETDMAKCTEMEKGK